MHVVDCAETAGRDSVREATLDSPPRQPSSLFVGSEIRVLARGLDQIREARLLRLVEMKILVAVPQDELPIVRDL
ncbi:hypothetical protein [Burkholderia alba]|uniref:hypothetical protein n=1 Tax=Burkholderia alba TaxID=2683677 RepID=UPI002B0625C6|nr:hypothetical protein [Burkholderia alba]